MNNGKSLTGAKNMKRPASRKFGATLWVGACILASCLCSGCGDSPINAVKKTQIAQGSPITYGSLFENSAIVKKALWSEKKDPVKGTIVEVELDVDYDNNKKPGTEIQALVTYKKFLDQVKNQYLMTLRLGDGKKDAQQRRAQRFARYMIKTIDTTYTIGKKSNFRFRFIPPSKNVNLDLVSCEAYVEGVYHYEFPCKMLMSDLKSETNNDMIYPLVAQVLYFADSGLEYVKHYKDLSMVAPFFQESKNQVLDTIRKSADKLE